MIEKLTPVFTPPYDEWTPCIISESKHATRNTKPVMKDDPNIETTFRQELNNPYVRNRTYVEGVEDGDHMFEDMAIQLKAAQETAVFFENIVETLGTRYDKLFRSWQELKVENIGLKNQIKQGGLWKRFWKFLDAREGDI